MIKNYTIYKGKPYLKFEKSPNYNDGTKLNKVHLDLGFTKLVSRVKIQQSLNEGFSSYDPKKIQLIRAYTGGTVCTYQWWEVKGSTGVFKSTIRPKYTKDIVYHGVLANSFVSKDGVYIGDLERAWWYFNKEMLVCRKHPNTVAIKVKSGMYDYTPDNHFNTEISSDSIEGYYGYSHRGGQLFKIGDRLFDSKYIPVEEDYEDWEWSGFINKFKEAYNVDDELNKKWLDEFGISSVIPFNLRGKKIIENWSEAMEAAYNLSINLS